MTRLRWYRIADTDELPEGRVKTVVAGRKTLALTHFDGRYNALDNACPHQGGPLGEGSIENGWLRSVAVTGDGGFGQYMAELTTAVKHGMNINHVLPSSNELGKIGKEQRAGNRDVWQTALHNPNFAHHTENCGALGIRLDGKGQLDDALERALARDGPALVDGVAEPVPIHWSIRRARSRLFRASSWSGLRRTACSKKPTASRSCPWLANTIPRPLYGSA